MSENLTMFFDTIENPTAINQEVLPMPPADSVNNRSVRQSASDVRALIVAELAAVRALAPEELDQELAADGDIEIDSKEAEAILSRIEVLFDCQLPTVSDLEPEQLNTVATLADLVMRRLPATDIAAQSSRSNRTGADARVA